MGLGIDIVLDLRLQLGIPASNEFVNQAFGRERRIPGPGVEIYCMLDGATMVGGLRTVRVVLAWAGDHNTRTSPLNFGAIGTDVVQDTAQGIGSLR